MFGLRHALRGIGLMLLKERNFKIQLVVFVLVVIAGIICQLQLTDWIIIMLISCVVLTLEIINSVIEKVCNYLTLERNPTIKNIKDISAAAVLVASLFAVIIGGFVFYPYLF